MGIRKMMLNVDHLQQMGVPPIWATHLISAMNEFGITTRDRAAMFLAQCAHESTGFKRFEEGLSYNSPERILLVFRRLRPLGIEGVAHLVRNPKALANRAYAGINGNGDEASGDGYRYRGRGIIQLTGRANYGTAGAAIGHDLITNPDDASTPHVGSRVAGWFWKSRGLNELADAGDFMAITRKINGGLVGIADRREKLAKIERIVASA